MKIMFFEEKNAGVSFVEALYLSRRLFHIEFDSDDFRERQRLFRFVVIHKKVRETVRVRAARYESVWIASGRGRTHGGRDS